MITNERQYQASRAQAARFRAAIDVPGSNISALHPRGRKALRDVAQSRLDEVSTMRPACYLHHDGDIG